MNNLRANYERILEVLRKISTERQLSIQLRPPTMSDLEVISLSLTAEYMDIDSENDLFRKLPSCLRSKIDCTVYNRRKRRLMPYQNGIRMKVAESFNESEDVFIVDSMPLEICKIARSSRSKICKEEHYSMPAKEYCASQKMYNYGYKLHAVYSLKGIFQSIDLTAANVHTLQLGSLAKGIDDGENMRPVLVIKPLYLFEPSEHLVVDLLLLTVLDEVIERHGLWL
ncbi:MAG: transposase [Sphingobacterium sp.]|jgi:hypothetical protein|nr:transposase [Sphingobacterium sp.]